MSTTTANSKRRAKSSPRGGGTGGFTSNKFLLEVIGLRKSKPAWPKFKLAEVADLCLGKMLDKKKNRGELHPYLGNIHVRWGAFDLKELPEMRFEEHEHERYGLKRGDLVVCEGGEPGRCALWNDQIPNMKIQKALHRVRPHACLDSRYLFYWFLWAAQRNYFDQFFTGATIKHLPGEKLAKVEIDLPDLPTQRRIAGILSAYDDLIENNLRRIRILEDMAQSLYREWFVHFRFPGHEAVKLVDSPLGRIPEGWEVTRIGVIAEVIRGRSYRSQDLVDEGGLPFLNLKCLERDGGFRRSGLKRYTGEYKSSHLARKGDIVMAVTDMTQDRRIVARAALVPTLDKEFGIASMDLVRIEPKPQMSKAFLYSLLRYSSFADEVKQHANGANVLHLAPDRIADFRCPLPPGDLIASFAAFVAPILEQIDIVQNKIENLRRTRDLVLPRLLSEKLTLNPKTP